VLIVGASNEQVARAIHIAVRQGGALRHVATPEAAVQELGAGRGADLLLVDVAVDIARLIGVLGTQRIFAPVVAYGVGTDARTAVTAIEAGAREFLPLRRSRS
jgi:two-component system, response regulator FlrC